MPQVRPRSPTAVALTLIVLVVIAWWQWQRDARQGPPAASLPAAVDATRAPESAPTPASDRYDLGRDERRGGHTLARHVGKSDDELRDRLRREPGISAASTYTDRTIAERSIARALDRERSRVAAWRAREGSRPNLAIDYRGPRDQILGRSLRRGLGRAEDCWNAVVVLRWERDGGYIVLTSYPEAAR